jgi:hypothetical protein
MPPTRIESALIDLQYLRARLETVRGGIMRLDRECRLLIKKLDHICETLDPDLRREKDRS